MIDVRMDLNDLVSLVNNSNNDGDRVNNLIVLSKDTTDGSNRVVHSHRLLIYPSDANKSKRADSVPFVFNYHLGGNSQGSYSYRRDCLNNGALYLVGDSLYICRAGRDHVYLIKIPVGLV